MTMPGTWSGHSSSTLTGTRNCATSGGCPMQQRLMVRIRAPELSASGSRLRVQMAEQEASWRMADCRAILQQPCTCIFCHEQVKLMT